MTESLKRRTHDDIVRRWFAVRTPGNASYGKPDYSTEHIQSLDIGYMDWRNSRFEHGDGDELRSYGSHFPLVNAIRDRRNGRVRLWLLNGDRWGGSGGFGVSTSSQQAMVRNLAETSGIPTIILPHSALNAAGVEFNSIRPLSVDADEWHSEEFRTNEFPADGEWRASHEAIEGTGYGILPDGTYGSVRYASMEDIPADIRAYFDSEGRVLPLYRYDRPKRVSFGRTHDDWNAPHPARDYATADIKWERYSESFYVPPVYRYVGRTLHGAHGEYTIHEDGSYSQTRQVHQLGQSVFRAAYRGNNGKRYFANFLSGVDNSPTGSGYFLVQLPKGADVSSVASAIESLKPETVRTAESMGIEVKRQGDLFAIPTEFSMRGLRKMGADIRRSALASETKRARITESWNDRYLTTLMSKGIPSERWARVTDEQSKIRDQIRTNMSRLARAELAKFDAAHAIHAKRELYGTRHYGTDIAILPNGVFLARGTIRHSGGDHSMLRLGNVWHIVVRNTVPLSR